MRSVDKDISFPQLEELILNKWKEENTFHRSLSMRADSPDYVFYDGPPFANNLPHYGHLLAGIIKDIVPRYWTMKGFKVERRFGWDTHGLPVEMEVEKDLGIVGKGISEIGVDKFNESCRASVLKYSKEWERTVLRTGRWVDFENRYLTMTPEFMETVWWVFKELWNKGLIYEGHRILPYSTGCHTPLSNFEASADYRDVQDPAITLTMPLLNDENTKILIWTTTPWTLPSNLAVAVHPNIDYVYLRDLSSDTIYILAETLISTLFKKESEYEIIKKVAGSELKGLEYVPLFDFFKGHREKGAFRVLVDEYVTADDGTGIVHLAPAYGEDDYRVCQREGIPLVDPVNLDGKFTEEVTDWAGLYIKDADPLIIQDLKKRGRVVKHSTIVHSYPYCERSGYPLMYKAMPVWFVKVTEIKERILKCNLETSWIPEHLRDGRFGKWLEGARDWNISRNRYWGTPIPIYRCASDNCKYIHVVGSIKELEEMTGQRNIDDLHMHKIDHMGWTCPDCGGRVSRISEVLDCWFESGAMPYAQNHYPFENKEHVERNLPADFIAEGLDQTRGWFYTLMILSTALFDRPAFKNVVVNGLILAEDGKKMSKRLRNYPAPDFILDQYGADALRLYLINSGLVRAEDLRFSESGVRDIIRLAMLPLWNAYNFFVTYAKLDNFEGSKVEDFLPSENILDQWILSRVETLNSIVINEMDSYRLYRVVPALIEFIDDLTNWYIRLNRRRFWQSGENKDKFQAYATLFSVLKHFSVIMAPFTPFLAEEIFCNLTDGFDKKDSVHLQDFPVPENSRMDENLEYTFSLMKESIVMGRVLREQQKIGVRQPLPVITLIHSNINDLKLLEQLESVIKDELNIKNIHYSKDESDFVTLEAKPNLKVLGPKFGKKMKDISAAIGGLTQDELRKVVSGDTIDICGEQLTSECFLISRNANEGILVQAGSLVSVSLDTTITPELRLEGLAREMINRIQRLRKDSGFEVQDRIQLGLKSDNKEIIDSFKLFNEYISNEVLAVSTDYQLDLTSGVCKDFSIQDYSFSVSLTRI
ncbi:isoleucine--tRNA ligase [Myxococcota bacterium]|nr:isoleucine--tRNA ligase [Myxococcota bacterium]MBU1381463.1 isoleucine--tRNA ligase [Myxococcota bacterium]MBU1497703.1 isoleucine--tRNA ligase [Myxococcota bacterium]